MELDKLKLIVEQINGRTYIDSEDSIVAVVGEKSYSQEYLLKSKEVANLMASAPELYRALKATKDILISHTIISNDSKIMKIINQALAKAEGE